MWRQSPQPQALMLMPNEASQPILVPFLKWAGGKRWLTANYTHLFPTHFNRYFEPFLGSGAAFFHLRPSEAVLSDANAELVNVYEQIRTNWKLVDIALKRHSRNHGETYYYEERDRKHRAKHEKAAQFLYLNRTCWNGLYRVNLKGKFNVPIGTKDTVLLDTDDFAGASLALQGATLSTNDFEPVLNRAKKDDFVFIDPPYVTRHNFNGFVKYNDKIFSWTDQQRLAKAIRAVALKGAKILLTNADHHSVRKLYADLGKRVTLRRHSVLAADSENRGEITEIAILINYEG